MVAFDLQYIHTLTYKNLYSDKDYVGKGRVTNTI